MALSTKLQKWYDILHPKKHKVCSISPEGSDVDFLPLLGILDTFSALNFLEIPCFTTSSYPCLDPQHQRGICEWPGKRLSAKVPLP